MQKYIYIYLFSILMLQSCKKKSDVVEVVVDSSKVYQTIEGFGASDAWRCQFVGKNWPVDKKTDIATLLFSQENDTQGNPKGIGLSLWRFYIGAGSSEQGEASSIKNEWRRAESFIDENGNYDWNKQEGQQWFLREAKKHGVEKLLAFSIAAPTFWSVSGKGYAQGTNGLINLREDKFEAYSEFLVEVVSHFEKEGLFFDYLSPINEPQWDWDKPSQEGTPASNKDIIQLSNSILKKLGERESKTQVVLTEAADLRWLYSSFNKENSGNQIENIIENPISNSLKISSNFKKTISGHSYFTTWPTDSLIAIRTKLKTKLDEANLGFWQSEFCILEETDDIGNGNTRDLGINTALYVARVIHADLTLANASSWQWWTALTIADYKDGLIYLDTGNKDDMYNMASLKNEGEYRASKLLWALGNYSRFIRPGMVRIGIDTNEDKDVELQYKDVMLSAYVNNETSEISIVAINYSNQVKSLEFPNLFIDSKYVTSMDKNLEKVLINENNVLLEARSVNTLVGKLKS